MNDGAANDGTATVVNYRPHALSSDAASFARRCVSACAPATRGRAKALLFATGKLGEFCSLVGLELTPAICLHPSVIERFIATGCESVSPATRRTLRTNLRYVQTALLPERPSPLPLSRERAKAPYDDAEIAAYLACCDAQPTALRRHRSAALVSLGAGAGLIGAELRYVRGSDVVHRSGGVLVEVGGNRSRSVPVRAFFEEPLVAAAAFFGPRYLVSGRNPDSYNVTSPLIGSLSGGTDLPRLEPSRLRSTYLCAMAETIGLKAFMDAAGITCSQRLGDLVSSLAPLHEDAAVALLRGRR